MNYFIIPAAIGLLVNLLILIAAYKGRQKSPLFFYMVMLFVLLQLCEVTGFLELFLGAGLEYQIRCYYVVMMAGLAAEVLYAGQVSGSRVAKLNILVSMPIVVLSAFILFSDFIVSGSQSIGYMQTAVRGEAYGVFQLLAVGLQLGLLSLLFAGIKYPQGSLMKTQCIYTLVAIAPLIFGNIALIVLMNLGYSINATVIIPMTLTIFVLITVYTEPKHRITDVRRFLPFRAKPNTSDQIKDIYARYVSEELNYRDAISEIERLLIMTKYESTGRNASETAKLLGMPRTSLYSIFSRLDIKPKE